MQYQHEHIIQFYETDGMRIVHHSNYIRWFEETRVAWMSDLGFSYKQMEDEGISVPVLAVDAQYKKMLSFGDTAVIKMKVARITPVRLDLAYEVYSKESGQLTTTGQSQHCFLDSDSHRPLSLKRRNPDLLALFEKAASED